MVDQINGKPHQKRKGSGEAFKAFAVRLSKLCV